VELCYYDCLFANQSSRISRTDGVYCYLCFYSDRIFLEKHPQELSICDGSSLSILLKRDCFFGVWFANLESQNTLCLSLAPQARRAWCLAGRVFTYSIPQRVRGEPDAFLRQVCVCFTMLMWDKNPELWN
jgi:hypothetical protein